MEHRLRGRGRALRGLSHATRGHTQCVSYMLKDFRSFTPLCIFTCKQLEHDPPFVISKHGSLWWHINLKDPSSTLWDPDLALCLFPHRWGRHPMMSGYACWGRASLNDGLPLQPREVLILLQQGLLVTLAYIIIGLSQFNPISNRTLYCNTNTLHNKDKDCWWFNPITTLRSTFINI